MTDYKLVPVEPTPEMVEAGEYAQYTGCYVSGIYADMLAAAPAVQGEPVAWRLRTPEGRSEYRPPQLPAAWQPCPESIREGAPYDDPAFSALCREHEVYGTAAAAQCAVFWEAGKRVAEQRAAQDVTKLVEALERLVGDVERATHVEFGGTPWLKEKMAEIDYARAALAAHRKGGGK